MTAADTLSRAMIEHAARQNDLAWILGAVAALLLTAAIIHLVRR